MKIGIIVDGYAEFASMRPVTEKVRSATGDTFLRIVKADVQPLAPIPVMAKGCQNAINQLKARGADLVVVLVDCESNGGCPVKTARDLEIALKKLCGTDVRVVVKDAMFENWLMADLVAVRAHRKRFKISKATANVIEPNKADSADAAKLIRRATIGADYDKVEDARTILSGADPDRMGKHSRSFRRFLRILRHPTYATQSKLP